MRLLDKPAFVLVAALALVAAGCDGDDEGDGDGDSPTFDAATASADASAATSDAGDAPDAAPFAGIVCGAMTCAPGELCCTDSGMTKRCVTEEPGACTGDDIATCDGPEDCAAAQVCCGLGGGASSTSCTAEASCTAGLPRCHSGADCASNVCCPQGFCGPGCD